MSAAATAAGYLYASGRLRAKKEEAEKERGEAPVEKREGAPRRQIRVAVYQPADQQPKPGPRRQPKIEYKTKRWKPE